MKTLVLPGTAQPVAYLPMPGTGFGLRALRRRAARWLRAWHTSLVARRRRARDLELLASFGARDLADARAVTGRLADLATERQILRRRSYF